ncbi:MAG: hypothetical protein AAF330_04255 [Pseudomonadota bacterium]
MTISKSGLCRIAALVAVVSTSTAAFAQNPIASNNGMYPKASEYGGPLNLSNLDYPDRVPPWYDIWELGADTPDGSLTPAAAGAYMERFKVHLGGKIRTLINEPEAWDPKQTGMFDMIWMGDGSDPTSGREAIMNTYTGQIVPSDSWTEQYRPTTSHMQNYGVVYYDALAATTLARVWANMYNPDLNGFSFPPGSVIVKVEAATVAVDEWPIRNSNGMVTGSVLEGSATWNVFRPTTDSQLEHDHDSKHELKNVVQQVHPVQIAVKVKDPVASPKTGWVYMGFVYDSQSADDSGGPWGRFVPAGATWGNDPDGARDPSGLPPDGVLKETWVNPNAPGFIRDTLGWGGRMAAPMDVARRHNVLMPDGTRIPKGQDIAVSSCMSCHGSAQYPFVANLYPSPNVTFPLDGEQFLLYTPGSEEWAQWFQNRPGDEPMTPHLGGVALDYDLMSMFALSSWAGAVGNEGFAFERFDIHH